MGGLVASWVGRLTPEGVARLVVQVEVDSDLQEMNIRCRVKVRNTGILHYVQDDGFMRDGGFEWLRMTAS